MAHRAWRVSKIAASGQGPPWASMPVGGAVAVRDSLFHGFLPQPGHLGETNYGVHTAFTKVTLLERNTVPLLPGSSVPIVPEPRASGPDSPYCQRPWLAP